MNVMEWLTPPSDLLPNHVNLAYKNSTQYWTGTDQRAVFEKNLKNPVTAAQLKNLGWDTADISYCYNSHGFRSAEFDRRNCGLALGCSFTEGTGLPVDTTWPYLLSNMCGTQVWNLGVGGSSIETVFRIFEHYVQTLQPKFVCVLMPPPWRLEFNNNDNGFPVLMAKSLGLHESFAKDWLSQDHNGIYNRKKTMLAMDNICKHMNIPMVFGDSSDSGIQLVRGVDLARDLRHYGVVYQQRHANRMLAQLITCGIEITPRKISSGHDLFQKNKKTS